MGIGGAVKERLPRIQHLFPLTRGERQKSPAQAGGPVLIMESTGKNDALSLRHRIDEAVRPVDPSGPAAMEVVEERFRLADSFEGIGDNCPAERMDALVLLAVVPLPVEIVLMGRVREDDAHSGLEVCLAHLSLPRLPQRLLDVPAIVLRREEVRCFLERCEFVQGENDCLPPFPMTHNDFLRILLGKTEEMREVSAEVGEGDRCHKKYVNTYVL